MATTNNIGLYCFSTGEEDAKTSLEALFGAGNSNMKKIDDAIGELRKKSFIVNTETELNALLTEENLGKTVSYNGALYIITDDGGSIIAKPVGAEGGGLPSFAPEDAGKFLRVDSNGNIVAEAIAYAEGESF